MPAHYRRWFARAVLMTGLALSSLIYPYRTLAADAVSGVDPAIYGAWTVTAASDPAGLGVRFFFSPDGVFLMVNPQRQVGAAGSYVIGRAGLMISLYSYGGSSEFITGDATVQGDNLMIDVRRSGVIVPQRMVLRRMPLQ